MHVSVFDLFKIGIGPSSSHTVGPMNAAGDFLLDLEARGLLEETAQVRVDLYGSLALTGKGHATDVAIMLGLAGERPATVDPDRIGEIIGGIRERKSLPLLGRQVVPFVEASHLVMNKDTFLEQHSNGMIFRAFNESGDELHSDTMFSVGGGFVTTAEAIAAGDDARGVNVAVPYDFATARELLEIGRENGLSISEIMMQNERAIRSDEEIEQGLDDLWEAMSGSIDRGCREEGLLPGGLNVKRRAAIMQRDLLKRPEAMLKDPLTILDWVNMWALAVNEENAAGGRVVTAPTNGAAGVIPAVLMYYDRFIPNSTPEGIRKFLLTAAAIGALYKKNASISAAEVGCQGEVGAACSMAAGALTAALGGTNEQVENAAEIGMEHNLGLTCDPIGGLVQVPCIERNTMGAAKAINAARLSLRGDGKHFVPLDDVIETMRQTGLDMQSKYKETSQGGLAVNVIAC
jgi:L-serine dehydratase